MPKPNKNRAMKPAMMGLIGPMALMLATLTAVSKASSGEGPSHCRFIDVHDQEAGPLGGRDGGFNLGCPRDASPPRHSPRCAGIDPSDRAWQRKEPR